MASQSLTTDPGVDLTGCDREPIHVPGSVQPHGLLLIADARTLEVVAGAGDLEARLDPAWLGASLPDLLGQDVAALMAPVTAGPGGTVVGAPMVSGAERLDVAFHRAGDLLLAELEPAAAEPLAAATMLSRLDLLAQGFERGERPSGAVRAGGDRLPPADRVRPGHGVPLPRRRCRSRRRGGSRSLARHLPPPSFPRL